MKKLSVLFFLSLFFLFACSGLLGCSDSGSSDGVVGIDGISIGQNIAGSISTIGEVDWYSYQALEANRVIQIKCKSNTFRADVDLLVTVFEEDENGNKVRLYADHAREDSQMPADIVMYVHIDNPKTIFISVRDLMDDEASGNEYYLSIDVSDSMDGNESFAQASALGMGCQSKLNDTIGYIGDVDTFRFDAQQDGVYEVAVDFSAKNDTAVSLAVDLYDDTGTLIDSLKRTQGDSTDNSIWPYHMRPFLALGTYYILVYDSARDDYDTMSSYDICVQPVTVDEANTNDAPGSATVLNPSDSGALDYLGDKDYYQFSTGGGLSVVTLDFEVADIMFNYRISIENSSGVVLFSHNQAGGQMPAGQPLVFSTQVLTSTVTNYLVVEASSEQVIFDTAPYSVSVDVIPIDDYYDENGLGNSESSPVVLDSSCLVEFDCPNGGHANYKIAYRGDVDWYSIDVPASVPQKPKVVEVFLDSHPDSPVEFYLRAKKDDGSATIRSVHGNSGESVKLSILAPASDSTATYLFRVADFQGDEGDTDHDYVIRARVQDIPTPTDLPALPAGVTSPTYHSEVGEALLGDSVIVEHNSLNMDSSYNVNTLALDFLKERISTSGDLTIELPWIGGYVDYQGDIDLFKVDLGNFSSKVDLSNSDEDWVADSNWYYDIKVEMFIGSEVVEYIWEFYRDSNRNGVLTAANVSGSGVFAASVDDEPNVTAPNTIVSTDGEEFWAGNNDNDDDQWAGASDFYIGIRDFNYLSYAPDDDWSFDGEPYYFKLTLVYHPGVSNP